MHFFLGRVQIDELCSAFHFACDSGVNKLLVTICKKTYSKIVYGSLAILRSLSTSKITTLPGALDLDPGSPGKSMNSWCVSFETECSIETTFQSSPFSFPYIAAFSFHWKLACSHKQIFSLCEHRFYSLTLRKSSFATGIIYVKRQTFLFSYKENPVYKNTQFPIQAESCCIHVIQNDLDLQTHLRSNSSEILSRSIPPPNFGSIRHLNCSAMRTHNYRQIHTHTYGTDFIPWTTDGGGKMVNMPSLNLDHPAHMQ